MSSRAFLFPIVIASLALVFLGSCRDGDTREIFELVLVSELNIQSLALEKQHKDNLRPGREISIRAIATLASGEETDLTEDVRWSSADESALAHQGGGVFKAVDVNKTQTVKVKAVLAQFESSESVTVSIADLESLQLGLAKSGTEGACQINEGKTQVSQCSSQALCVLGSYEGESDKRDESAYVAWENSGDSIVESGQLINAPYDVSSEPIESVTANLDMVDSNVLQVQHKADLTELGIINNPSSVLMGESADFDVDLDDSIKPYVQWLWDDLGNVGQPEAEVSVSGNTLTAKVENDYVSNWDEYGVAVSARCAGFESESVDLLIESDINTLLLSDNDDDSTLILGDQTGVDFTLAAEDEDALEVLISDGEVAWYVCDLADTECSVDDQLDEDGAVLNLVVDSPEYEEGDIRIEAIYHGRKATEQGFTIAP